MKSEPSKDKTSLFDLSTKLIRYSDLHCKILIWKKNYFVPDNHFWVYYIVDSFLGIDLQGLPTENCDPFDSRNHFDE